MAEIIKGEYNGRAFDISGCGPNYRGMIEVVVSLGFRDDAFNGETHMLFLTPDQWDALKEAAKQQQLPLLDA